MNAKGRPSSFSKRNGLSLVLLTLLLLSLAGHMAAGWSFSNGQRVEHGQSEQSLVRYLSSGEFLSSLMENWESEFLQMGLYVLLTVRLRQFGSAESRPFDPEEENRKKESFPIEQQPWPMRRGGLWQKLYERSLSMTLLALFVFSFVAHFINSWRQHVEEQRLHGGLPTPMGDYLWDAEFWFQSFQNWQSEFVAVLALVLLSIVLRQKDSPQSKQVDAPHSHTGH